MLLLSMVLAESTASESSVGDGEQVSPQAPVPVSNAVQLSFCFVAFKAWL